MQIFGMYTNIQSIPGDYFPYRTEEQKIVAIPDHERSNKEEKGQLNAMDKGQIQILSFRSIEAWSDHSFHKILHRNHTLNIINHAYFCALGEYGGFFISSQIFQSTNSTALNLLLS